MAAGTANRTTASLCTRSTGRPRCDWATAAISLVLVLPPLGAVAVDGTVVEFFRQSHWRVAFLAPAVSIYILAVAPLLKRTVSAVLNAFRSLVLLDDETYNQTVTEATRTNPIVELAALGTGWAFDALGPGALNMRPHFGPGEGRAGRASAWLHACGGMRDSHDRWGRDARPADERPVRPSEGGE